MSIPSALQGQRYISLITFRKSGVPVPTAVWFGEQNDKLYVMSNNNSGKLKRIRNNSKVRVASCSIRGKITGPEFSADARVLPSERGAAAKKTITEKYWLARLPFLWRNSNAFLEIEVSNSR